MPANAGSSPTFIPGLKAGASALTQYRVVKFSANTANCVVNVAATTDVAIGVVQNDPAGGGEALVQNAGEALCIAGVNDLAAGDNVGYDSTGRVVDHTTDNRLSIGRAREASTAIGDYVRVLLYGGAAQRY